MLARLVRSWDIVKASGAVIRDDPALLILPLLSSLTALLIILSFTLPLLFTGIAPETNGRGDAALYLWLFLLYIALYFVTFFFNTALVSVALERFEGRRAGIGEGIALATGRALRLLGYAVLAATVGLVLRTLEERVGWVGRMVIALLGTAWTVTTFLVVPVLVTRDVSPIEAVADSARLLKATWGENVIGNVGIGATFGLAYTLLAIGAGAGAVALAGAGFGAWALGVIATALLLGAALVLVQNALQAIYSAALYRHVVGAGIVEGFPPDLLAQAFVTRKRH